MRVEGKSLPCPSELVGVVDSRYLPSARSMGIPVTSLLTILYICALCKYK